MHTSLKIIKTLLYSYSAQHVSGTLAPIIRSLPILHTQPPVTYQLKTYFAFKSCEVMLLFTYRNKSQYPSTTHKGTKTKQHNNTKRRKITLVIQVLLFLYM
jgi:hypothetical protein